ncbi:MAG TPA: 2-oxoacid:ferredoxin oxidoreductase subunit gamma [Firmicutes bacterium]|nr:2-oxoacid:ferredoxin oxidoreductase subunit gamma [Bacillota bacterium]
MARQEILLTGSGGQGLILAGIILAEAAAVYDGTNAIHNQSYGPEARGGASKSEVIISDEDIDFPEISSPDILLAMTQLAADKYSGQLKAGGTLIVDPLFVKNIPASKAAKVVKIPLTQVARDEVGRELVANIVAVGAIAVLTGLVSREAAEKAVLKRVPKGTEELNRKALMAGFAAAEKVLG